MFLCEESSLKGCYEITPKVFTDERGDFTKVYHNELFSDLGIKDNFVEEYYSRSIKNVIRGLHFQLPPSEHSKLVYCIEGAVLDAVVDLRRNSDTFGKFATFQLNRSNAKIIYIPQGFAHGFCTLSDEAVLVYKTSTVYDPKSDFGISWNSAKIPWPCDKPIISKRDMNQVPLSSFDSPFYLKDEFQ